MYFTNHIDKNLKRSSSRVSNQKILFLTNTWLTTNRNLCKAIWTHYGKISKNFLFGSKMTRQLETLLASYNYLMIHLVRNFLNDLPKLERLSQCNLPECIQNLQNAFLESTAITLHAINVIKKAHSNKMDLTTTSGFKSFKFFKDAYIQTRLRGSRFDKSGKSLKVKKDLPKVCEITPEAESLIKRAHQYYNKNLSLELLAYCNLGQLSKAYKYGSVDFYNFKDNTNKILKLALPFMCNRVLEVMLYMAIAPIVQYQSAAFSRNFDTENPLYQPIYALTRIINCDSFLDYRISPFRPNKVDVKAYYAYSGKKIKVKHSSLRVTQNQRRRLYLYKYYIFTKSKYSVLRKLHTPYQKYLNINLFEYPNSLKHNLLLPYVPLSSKYLYLVQL